MGTEWAKECRERARELRALAVEIDDLLTRANLIRSAECCERLAEEAERESCLASVNEP
jgi:hypothetical protein